MNDIVISSYICVRFFAKRSLMFYNLFSSLSSAFHFPRHEILMEVGNSFSPTPTPPELDPSHHPNSWPRSLFPLSWKLFLSMQTLRATKTGKKVAGSEEERSEAKRRGRKMGSPKKKWHCSPSSFVPFVSSLCFFLAPLFTLLSRGFA